VSAGKPQGKKGKKRNMTANVSINKNNLKEIIQYLNIMMIELQD